MSRPFTPSTSFRVFRGGRRPFCTFRGRGRHDSLRQYPLHSSYARGSPDPGKPARGGSIRMMDPFRSVQTVKSSVSSPGISRVEPGTGRTAENRPLRPRKRMLFPGAAARRSGRSDHILPGQPSPPGSKRWKADTPPPKGTLSTCLYLFFACLHCTQKPEAHAIRFRPLSYILRHSRVAQRQETQVKRSVFGNPIAQRRQRTQRESGFRQTTNHRHGGDLSQTEGKWLRQTVHDGFKVLCGLCDSA